jgi:hypothetical protein
VLEELTDITNDAKKPKKKMILPKGVNELFEITDLKL